MKKTWLGVGIAVAGGLLWGLCFARQSLQIAPWFALAPLVLLLGTRAPGRLAFLHGLASWSLALSWIAPTLQTFGGIPTLLSIGLTGLLAAYLALFHAAFGWLGAPVWRRGGWLRLLVLPALWVALEWLRAHLFGGFPWNLAAYAWVDVAGALPLSAWIGAYGVSFLVLLTSTAVAAIPAILEKRAPAAGRRGWEPLLACLLLPLLLLPLAGRWSARRSDTEQRRLWSGAGGPVRLLQPNIPNQMDWDPQIMVRNYRKVMDLSIDSCQPGALVVWPESAAWPFSYGRDPMLASDLQALVDRGCTVIFNSSFPVEESFYNSAFLLAPGKEAVRYDKRHLVPFGEYVPFRGLFSFMDKLARNAGEYRASDRVVLLPWNNEKLGMAICYEIVYPAEVAELTQAGATILVTITNDAWYGDTAAPWQHLRAARFRAAENRRTTLRAAITGVSALIGPDGAVHAQIGVFRQGVIRGLVVGKSGLTPYARFPWLVPLLCSLVSGVAVLAIWFARRRPVPVLR